MRGRSYSYSPPVRSYGRRGRSPSPRGYGGRSRDLPTSLLVRNLRSDCRPDDLRRPFEQFGPLKDVYLPRDYYTGEPRGFGFVQYVDPDDAVEAKYKMDGQILHGRELTVVFAEENRKMPAEMRARDRIRSRSYDRRRSPGYSRSSRRSRSRSPRYSQSPRDSRSRSRSPAYYSPIPSRRRRYSRSPSPRDKRSRRERSYSRSPARSPADKRLSRSRSLLNLLSIFCRSSKPSHSERRWNSGSPPDSRSRSKSPSEDYPSKRRPGKERSVSISE